MEISIKLPDALRERGDYKGMIEAWNERVHGDDTVYIVGDMYLVQKR